MKKIKYIGIQGKAIPIQWSLNVDDDIDWHNAIILSTIMSRGTDVSKLWNGTILFVENVSEFTLKPPSRLVFGGVRATPSANVQMPKAAAFGVSVGDFILAPPQRLQFDGSIKERVDPAVLTHNTENFTERLAAFVLSPNRLEFSGPSESVSNETKEE